MRSFLRSGLAFLSVGVVLLLALNVASARIAPVFPMERQRVAYLEEQREKVEVLVIGNSHGHAVNFGALKASGFHLWTPGQDVFETEALLAAWLPRLPALRFVLLPVGFSSFTTDNALPVRENRSQIRRGAYALLPDRRLIGWDWDNWVASRLSGVVREDHWQGVLGRVVPALAQQAKADREGFRAVDRDGFVRRGHGRTSLAPEQIAGEAERLLARQLATQADMLAADPDLPERARDALARCVRLVRESGATPILFRAPVHELYASGLDAETVKRTETLVERLETELALKVHDFSTDRAFVREPRFFFDPSHLNRVGAAVFSRDRLRALLERAP